MPAWLEVVLVAIWVIGWAAVAIWGVMALWEIGDPLMFLLSAPVVIGIGWMWPAWAAIALVLFLPYQLVAFVMERAGARRY